MDTNLKNVVATFVQAIDLHNHILKNHHKRVSVIALNLARSLKLSQGQMDQVVLAASLHDIGALHISDQDQLMKIDVENPHPHCRLGAYMLQSFEPFKDISRIIYYHHWHYCKRHDFDPRLGPVPIESFVLHLADRIEILIQNNLPLLDQVETITQALLQRNNSIFHPQVMRAYLDQKDHISFWLDIDNKDMGYVFKATGQSQLKKDLTMDLLEDFAYTASKITDLRSGFTAAHSKGVASTAFAIGKLLGYDADHCQKLKIAGLLHDIGKIGVDPGLIDKNGALSSQEIEAVKAHAYFTKLILSPLGMISDIIFWACHHHENHLGQGYPDGLTKKTITEDIDIIAYADIFTALVENRPYRRGLKSFLVKDLLNRNFRLKHGDKICDLILENFDFLTSQCLEAIGESYAHYKIFKQNYLQGLSFSP